MNTADQSGHILLISDSEELSETLGPVLIRHGFVVSNANFERASSSSAFPSTHHCVLIDARKKQSQAVNLLRLFRATPGLERLPGLLLTDESHPSLLDEPIMARGGVDTVQINDQNVLLGRLSTMIRLGRAETNLKKEINQHEAYSLVGETKALDASVQALRRLANEWGNVLMDVQVAASVITENAQDNPEINDQISTIRAAIARGQQWIRDIGVFRLEDYDPRPLNMRELIDRMVGCQFPSLPESLDVRVKIAQDIWPINGDVELLENALGHIISNAVDAMQGVGVLTIDIRNVKINKTIQLESIKPGPYIRINVTDTGMGIPSDIRDKVFEPFFTTKTGPRWKGLGLSQSQFIVRRHGGIIVVASDEEKGTKITILLPRSHDITSTVPAALKQSNPDMLSFLIIDDQPNIAKGMARALFKAGHPSLAIIDANEAVEHFKNYKDSIDYVVLDVNLGETSGFDVHRELEAIDPTIRIILVTGFASPDELADFSQRELTAILEKPFSPQDLLNFIKRTFPA